MLVEPTLQHWCQQLAHDIFKGAVSGSERQLPLLAPLARQSAKLRKRRGGANGQEFPFRPRVVAMGTDRFGKPMSTLVIDWGATTEAPTAAKADPRWSKSLRLLRQVLMNLLVDVAYGFMDPRIRYE